MKHTKILIVEDDLIVAREIERSIKFSGYDVIGNVTSSEETLKITAHQPVDLVLMDINIDGQKNGIETARIINSMSPKPIVFLTALSDMATLNQVKTVEPYGYIIKPFQDSDLSTTIELALDKFIKDQESKTKHLKLIGGVSIIEEGLFIINNDYTIDYINETAMQLSGKCLRKKEGKIHINSVIELFTQNKEKLSINYFLNNSCDISGMKFVCYFPILQDEHTFQIKTQRVIHENKLLGWSMILSTCESDSLTSNEKQVSVDLTLHHRSTSIFVRKGNKHVRVNFEEILYLEAMDNFVIIHTSSEKFVVYVTLKELEEKLPAGDFLKIHRSFIIQLDKITYLEENFITINNKNLPISRSYKKLLKSKVLFT